MVRVAGLKGQVAAGVTVPSQDGLTPAQQLAAINSRTERADAEPAGLLAAAPRASCAPPASPWSSRRELTAEERQWLDGIFLDQIFPVLTPLAIDPGASVSVHPQSRLLDRARAERQARTAARLRALLPLPQQIAALRPAAGRRTSASSARGSGRALSRPPVSRLRGRGHRLFPHHPRQRNGNRGRGRRSGATVRIGAQAPPARQRHPALKVNAAMPEELLRLRPSTSSTCRRRRARASTACSASPPPRS